MSGALNALPFFPPVIGPVTVVACATNAIDNKVRESRVRKECLVFIEVPLETRLIVRCFHTEANGIVQFWNVSHRATETQRHRVNGIQKQNPRSKCFSL